MLAIFKLGGSVLTGLDAYRRAAAVVRPELEDHPSGGARLVVVVSAQLGVTNHDLALARSIAPEPDPRALDLLWSTGEQRSVALLTLALQREGIAAVGLNVHETGLRLAEDITLNPSRLKAALAGCSIVVVPGFLALGAGERIVSLGRGGSDLTAVLIAVALGATRCALVKDVPGYFDEDPATHAHARHIGTLSYSEALAKEAAGCGLVQRAAIEAAARAGLPLIVRSLDPAQGRTLVTSSARATKERKENRMKFATRTIHAAQPSEPETGALVAPIFQTSTYEQEEPGVHKGFDYTRTRNPTRVRLERVLAELEGVEHAAVFASGLAAEHAVLQAYLKPGDEVVTTTDVYGGTWRLLHRVFQPLGCVIRQVDASDLDAVAAAVSSRTRLVWVESPTNPRLLVCDIAAIARIAHERGALLVADNTFATPFFQQPFELGADIVVHSVTKYLAGHSDLIQGAALARDAGVFEPIAFLQNAAGGVPSPFECWLTLRGLKTLELRMLRHAQNAAAIAEALSTHPLARRVYFPGLGDHPGHAIARRQMTGFGGMVSFELDGTVEDVVRFVSSRRFFTLGESLGGVKALICHPARMTHASIPAEARAALGLSDTLVRLSPGCENASDLVEDLVEGLDLLRVTREVEAAAV